MINNYEIETLSSFLFDEINNLTSGWNIKRSCEAHNLITFCVWYCCNTSGGIDDIIGLTKKQIVEVLDDFRHPKREYDEDNIYLLWHNQSRQITDHAERYQGKPASRFLVDLFVLYGMIEHGYYDKQFIVEQDIHK